MKKHTNTETKRQNNTNKKRTQHQKQHKNKSNKNNHSTNTHQKGSEHNTQPDKYTKKAITQTHTEHCIPVKGNGHNPHTKETNTNKTKKAITQTLKQGNSIKPETNTIQQTKQQQTKPDNKSNDTNTREKGETIGT